MAMFFLSQKSWWGKFPMCGEVFVPFRWLSTTSPCRCGLGIKLNLTEGALTFGPLQGPRARPRARLSYVSVGLGT